MKLSFFGLLTSLACQIVASPGGERCDRYEYQNICHHCPYGPHYPRELELEDRSRHRVCYKDCPKEWQQCKRWGKRDDYDNDDRHDDDGYDDYDYDGKFWLDYSQDFSCPQEFKFKVVVKIEENSGVQYLNVNQNYQGGGDKLLMEKRGRIGISHSSLGVYKTHESKYNPSSLNYNDYCHGNACSVPVKNLPGYPHLCNTEIYLAVGNDECYDSYGRDEHGYHDGTKYVKVTVRCGHDKRGKNRHCREYCCCPHGE